MGSNPAGSLFINFTEVILVQAWSGLVRPWELGCHCSANQVNDSTSSQPETTSQCTATTDWNQSFNWFFFPFTPFGFGTSVQLRINLMLI